jgi:hypothetical protein
MAAKKRKKHGAASRNPKLKMKDRKKPKCQENDCQGNNLQILLPIPLTHLPENDKC